QRGDRGKPGTPPPSTDGVELGEASPVAPAPGYSAPAAHLSAPDIVDAAQRAAFSSLADATAGPLDTSPTDATLFTPAPRARPPPDTPGAASPSRDRGRTPVRPTGSTPGPPTRPSAPVPDAQQPTEQADAAALAGKCSKADFASVYEAAAPTPAMV